MRAAKEAAAYFHSVPDHFTFAVFTNGRDGLNCALEAVKGMPCSSSYQFKLLVIFISANFAFRHLELPRIERIESGPELLVFAKITGQFSRSSA